MVTMVTMLITIIATFCYSGEDVQVKNPLSRNASVSGGMVTACPPRRALPLRDHVPRTAPWSPNSTG